MFLSDNGMAFPFSKTNCYLNSTRTPWIVTWPGRVKPGVVDTEHFISGIDYMATVLDAVDLPRPGGMDGFSFLPVLGGQSQTGRDKVFTEFHQTSARRRYPMRCVQDRRFGYLFNPWSDGQRVFRNESQSGLTFKAMQAAAEDDDAIEKRVALFLYRVVEEFYDLENDPDAVERLRRALAERMKSTGDPAWQALENRQDPVALARFMEEQDARAARGRKTKTKKR